MIAIIIIAVIATVTLIAYSCLVIAKRADERIDNGTR